MISIDDMDKIKGAAARLIDLISLNAPDEVVRNEVEMMRQLAGQAPKVETVKFKHGPLPPNPDGRNDDRAEWAGAALDTFKAHTNTEAVDAVADLLCDLIHWCDRNDGLDFDSELNRAVEMYEEETSAELPF